VSADAFPEFQLLPASADVLTADEELAAIQDPEAQPLPVSSEQDDTLPIGRSRWFDFATGRSGGSPRWARDAEAVIMVAQAALRTKRGEHSMLPDDFGMDEPDALIGHTYDAERVAAYEEDIEETLLACHDRITGVGNFMFLRDLDEEIAYVDLDIVIDGDNTIRLEGVPL
jgi:Protein of unknown function (DUF2634)